MNHAKSDQTCEDKITYESVEEARAADATSSHRYNKPRLTVYKCKKCGLFHLTASSDDE